MLVRCEQRSLASVRHLGLPEGGLQSKCTTPTSSSHTMDIDADLMQSYSCFLPFYQTLLSPKNAHVCVFFLFFSFVCVKCKEDLDVEAVKVEYNLFCHKVAVCGSRIAREAQRDREWLRLRWALWGGTRRTQVHEHISQKSFKHNTGQFAWVAWQTQKSFSTGSNKPLCWRDSSSLAEVVVEC